MHLLALLLMAAPAQPPAAAAPPPPPADTYPTTKGSAGVSFFLPGGGDFKLVGGTYFIADDVAARADIGLDAPLSPSGPGINKLFTISAGLRFYQLKRNRVVVFLQPGFALGRESSPAVSAEAALFVRFSGAAGVEYFFTNHFSVGATLELSLKLANIDGPAATSVYASLDTSTSSLAANIYF